QAPPAAVKGHRRYSPSVGRDGKVIKHRAFVESSFDAFAIGNHQAPAPRAGRIDDRSVRRDVEIRFRRHGNQRTFSAIANGSWMATPFAASIRCARSFPSRTYTIMSLPAGRDQS